MATINSHLDALWHALPSISRYSEEFKRDAPALQKDVEAFVKNAYRASFANADQADADSFAADFVAALPKPPALTNIPPLPEPAAEPSTPVAPPAATGQEVRPPSSGDAARPTAGAPAAAPHATATAAPSAAAPAAAAAPAPAPGHASPTTAHAPAAPPHDVEIGTIPREFFVDRVVKVLCHQIVPSGKAILALRPPAPVAPVVEAPPAAAPTGKKGDKAPAVAAPPAPAAPVYSAEELEFEAQLSALTEALVDDRAPMHLLAFGDVLTLPCAKLLPVALRSFAHTVRHPTHPACYDVMWKAIAHEGEAKANYDSFVAWFSQWAVRCFSNVTAKRAAIAARTHWLDATAATGSLKLPGFIATARALARLYLHEDGDTFFTEHVATITAAVAAAGAKATFLSVTPAPRAVRGALVDVQKLFVPDELDARRHDKAFYETASPNRIVIVGKEGVGKSSLATKLAERLNAVDVNTFTLALEALDAVPKGDELGVAIRDAIAAQQPITFELQAKLIRRCLERAATVHRGYVFGDMPATTEANRFVVDKFIASCGFEQWPTAVIDVTMASELYDDWRRKARDAITADYNHEIELRVQEAEAIAEKKRKEDARIARKEERERRAERQAKIDAGEIEATEDDKAWAAQEQEPEEEVQPEVDEEGNPLEPEQIAAREEAKKATIARRGLLAELRRQLHAGRQVPESEAQTDAKKLPAWAPAMTHCIERNRALTVTNSDDVAARVSFIVERLALVASIIPQRPTVAPESLEGIEAGPDGDNTKAELYRNTLTEAGMILSPFESFCPVTKFDNGVLITGSWAYSCHYRGSMYCFASEAKLQRFIDLPAPYLTQRFDTDAPVLILSKSRKVLPDAGIAADQLVQKLAHSLDLAPVEVAAYAASWKSFDAEVARRAGLVTSRAVADAKTVKAREERRKKAKEADKKGKGKAAEKPGAKKKKEGEEAEEDKPAVEAAAVVEDAAPKVITTEERIQAEIDAADARRLEGTLPNLVSTLTDVSKDELTWLFERRVLPESVVVLDWQAPRNEDEEEAPAEEADEEAEDANPEPQVDDDGNPIPPKPKVEKPFDQNDEKMYRKFINKFLEELAVVPEEGDAAPAVDADGKEIPAPRRRQLFNVRSINVFGMSTDNAVDTLVRSIRTVQDKVLPPQDGEELIADPDEEEGEEVDDPIVAAKKKLAIPGKRAIHQFGATLRYCPVTLKETGTLVTGDPANWVSYLSDRYLFVSPEAMEKFKLNPDRYLPSTPPTPPPPRIWILGVPHSGHDALAKSLSARYGVPTFSLEYANLHAVLAAATNPLGGTVVDVRIPYTDVAASVPLKTAADIAKTLAEVEATEVAKLKAKDEAVARLAAREAIQADGGEVSELDEDDEAELQKATEYEPEEEEAKTERVSREMRRMAANLMRIEPFESRGYFLVGRPNSEVEVEQLLSFGAYPEVVVNVKLPSETYVNRHVDSEFAKRQAAYKVQLAQVKETRRRLLRKQRAAEIEKWRRRNIGGGDEDAEEEEMPEDPEEPTLDAARSDLETQYETDTGVVAAVLAVLPDKRIPVVEVNGDLGSETVLTTALAALSTNLTHRRSFFENPYAVTYDQALEFIRTGRKFFSAFRFHDPVSLAAHRNGAPPTLRLKPTGRGIPIEPVIPEPEPEPPKPKRYKTITRTNEETDETEEVQVTDDEPEEEEAPEPVEEEELEAEPELSPEELQEMQAELDAKRKAAADKLKNRACVLRNRVYFFKDDANLITFLTENPLNFWDQPPPLPYVPSVVAFIDEQLPPAPTTSDARPRTMAHHLAHNLRAAFIDSTKLLKWATVSLAGTKTAARALSTILSGELIPDDLLAVLLAARVLCSDVQSQGAVLLNLPRSSAQLRALVTSGASIHKVLTYGNHLASMVNEIDNIALVSTKLVQPRFSNASLIETWQAVDQNKHNRQLVSLSRPLGYPVKMHDTSTSQGYLMSTRSVYKTYCPYTWSREGKLIDSFGDTKFAVEYCGQQFLFSCAEYQEAFLQNPQDFSGELTNLRELPTVLPRIIGAAEAKTIRADQLEHAACCPVTLYETREHKGLRGVTEPKAVPGSQDCIVEYNGLKYALVNKEAVNKFLRQPWVYVAGAVLPLATKMPFDREEVKSQNTDVYVRRVLYENVARAMLAVAEVRPKFPGLDARDSALKFIALHLKARNENNTTHRQNCYEENFTNYTERATLYKNIALDAPSDPAEEAEFRRRCALWDDLQDHPQCYVDYQHPAQKTKPPTH